MPFHPYLMFSGTCREAFTRYQEVFGGELEVIRMADMPSEEEVPPEQADLVAHAALTFGDNLLMASDDPGGDGGPVQGMMVNYSTPDLDEARGVFEALSEGGQVQMEMAETSWSPAFGMCADRFGTPWMISADPSEGSGG